MSTPVVINGREIPVCLEPEIVRKQLLSMQRKNREQFRLCIEEAVRKLKLWAAFKGREKAVVGELKAGGKPGWGARITVAVEFWSLIGDSVLEEWKRFEVGMDEVVGSELDEALANQEQGVADSERAAAEVVEGSGVAVADGEAVDTSGATIRADMKWVYHNLNTKYEVALRHAPSKGAAAMLRVAQADKSSFLESVMRVFAKEAEEERARVMDDGREQIQLLDEIRRASVLAERRQRSIS